MTGGLGGVGAGIAGGFRSVGHGVGNGFRSVGRGTANGFRSAGRGTANGFRSVGRGTANGVRSVGRGTAGGFRSVGRGAAGVVGVIGAAFALLGAWSLRAWRSPITRRVGIGVVGVGAATGVAFAGLNLAARDGDPVRDRVDAAPGQSRSAASIAEQDQEGDDPGVTAPGIHLAVSPEASGDLVVTERIIARSPRKALSLAPPPASTGGLAPAASLVDLEIEADGRPVPLSGSSEISAPRVVLLGREATTIELRYRVLGADERGEAAPEGRATLRLRPASSAALPTLPTVVQVSNAVVHTLVCTDMPPSGQLCGIDEGEDWSTEPVSAASATVVALVDLPTAL